MLLSAIIILCRRGGSRRRYTRHRSVIGEFSLKHHLPSFFDCEKKTRKSFEKNFCRNMKTFWRQFEFFTPFFMQSNVVIVCRRRGSRRSSRHHCPAIQRYRTLFSLKHHLHRTTHQLVPDQEQIHVDEWVKDTRHMV